MRRGKNALLVAAALLMSATLPPVLVACGSGSTEADGSAPWVGAITTKGNVTTVVNESGSLWGGTARLVEETSIGVESGETAYLFGSIGGVAAYGSRIYVPDTQVPVVRVFDEQGIHVDDIGRGGQGPGEFERPRRLAIDAGGRVYVREDGFIEVFSDAGELLDTWSTDPAAYLSSVSIMVASADGTILVPEYLSVDDPREFTPPWERRVAIRSFVEGVPQALRQLPEVGSPTPLLVIREQHEASVFSLSAIVPPFVPTRVVTLGHDAAVIIGNADRYEFEVHRADGRIT